MLPAPDFLSELGGVLLGDLSGEELITAECAERFAEGAEKTRTLLTDRNSQRGEMLSAECWVLKPDACPGVQ